MKICMDICSYKQSWMILYLIVETPIAHGAGIFTYIPGLYYTNGVLGIYHIINSVYINTWLWIILAHFLDMRYDQ